MLRHARLLEGKTLREAIGRLLEGSAQGIANEAAAEYSTAGGKGDFGNAIEAGHFYYRPNSDARPDFPWGDLKCTGLRQTKRGVLTPKERLVLSKIDYPTIVRQSFDDFQASQKLSRLLLVFYRYQRGVGVMDLRVELVDVWTPTPEDWRLIREDWESIKAKVATGRAQDLSEGLTKCLGACTKASDSTVRTNQPHGEPAKPRAYCLKRPFLDSIYRSLRAKRTATKEAEPVLVGIEEYLSGPRRFEAHVVGLFANLKGVTVEGIGERLGIPSDSRSDKGRHARLMAAVLNKLLSGDPRRKAESVRQFRKAGVVLRTVRIKPNGMPAEDVSFPAFDYEELADESVWEDSDLYALLTSRFLFVFLEEDPAGVRRLSHVAFWSMPESDLNGDAQAVWRETRDKVDASDVTDLPRASRTKAVHVRPHDTDSTPTVSLPNGTLTFRRSFWLNKRYVAAIFAATRDERWTG